ncbi:hypothetical protein HDU76_004272 [Blyttiomyces sp. JEL0837]|nr:hypothetical protein HDU76_004272 [Blyttiomyces sp. JEL0837]
MNNATTISTADDNDDDNNRTTTLGGCLSYLSWCLMPPSSVVLTSSSTSPSPEQQQPPPIPSSNSTDTLVDSPILASSLPSPTSPSSSSKMPEGADPVLWNRFTAMSGGSDDIHFELLETRLLEFLPSTLAHTFLLHLWRSSTSSTTKMQEPRLTYTQWSEASSSLLSSSSSTTISTISTSVHDTFALEYVTNYSYLQSHSRRNTVVNTTTTTTKGSSESATMKSSSVQYIGDFAESLRMLSDMFDEDYVASDRLVKFILESDGVTSFADSAFNLQNDDSAFFNIIHDEDQIKEEDDPAVHKRDSQSTC